MKKIAISVIIFLLIAFSGCGKKEVYRYNYCFFGENEIWEATMVYDAVDSISHLKDGTLHHYKDIISELTVLYKGEISDLSDLKHIEIECITNTCESKLSDDYGIEDQREQSYVMKQVTRDILREEDVITIAIDMDGKKQSFELKVK